MSGAKITKESQQTKCWGSPRLKDQKRATVPAQLLVSNTKSFN